VLKYGVSITDACVDWENTVKMLNSLNEVCFFIFLFQKLLKAETALFVGCESERQFSINAGFEHPAAFERVRAEEEAWLR